MPSTNVPTIFLRDGEKVSGTDGPNALCLPTMVSGTDAPYALYLPTVMPSTDKPYEPTVGPVAAHGDRRPPQPVSPTRTQCCTSHCRTRCQDRAYRTSHGNTLCQYQTWRHHMLGQFHMAPPYVMPVPNISRRCAIRHQQP
eukprot:2506581-Rhodomonas_salina.1